MCILCILYVRVHVYVFSYVGVTYDFRNDLYFWIIEGGQGPLYRFQTITQNLSRVQRALDRPVSLAADWVGRRLFWVQEGISVSYHV